MLVANTRHLIEIGCGRGQLTIPLAKLVRNAKITVVDRFVGPYRKDYGFLLSALSRERLKRRIHVVLGDYAESLSKEPNQRYDAVVSNEFLPELDFNEMKGFLSECYRVLKQDGITIQSFLSPEGRNSGQKLLIEADSNPRWTKFPPKEWFSPPPGLMVSELKVAGFRRIRVANARSHLILKADAARSVLGNWGVRNAFWESHESRLMSRGLEIPDWVVVAAIKSP